MGKLLDLSPINTRLTITVFYKNRLLLRPKTLRCSDFSPETIPDRLHSYVNEHLADLGYAGAKEILTVEPHKINTYKINCVDFINEQITLEAAVYPFAGNTKYLLPDGVKVFTNQYGCPFVITDSVSVPEYYVKQKFDLHRFPDGIFEKYIVSDCQNRFYAAVLLNKIAKIANVIGRSGLSQTYQFLYSPDNLKPVFQYAAKVALIEYAKAVPASPFITSHSLNPIVDTQDF